MKTTLLAIVLLACLIVSCKQEVVATPVPAPEKENEQALELPDIEPTKNEAPVGNSLEEVTNLQLSFKDTLDMGKVYANEKKHGEFTIKNVGKGPETIREVIPTCDCISLDKVYSDIVIPPGEELLIGFTMNAATVVKESFGRYILIQPLTSPSFKARVSGWIIQAVTVAPQKSINMGLIKDPATPWKQTFQIKGVADLPETLVLGEPAEHPNLNYQIVQTAPGEYDFTVTPKGSLPYTRQFHPFIHIPILHPAAATELVLELDIHVAEVVSFAPENWTIQKDYLEEEGSFTERFVYGIVPGVQEERKKGDSASDLKNMMKTSLLKNRNAVPLKFVKENHDWENLFEHIQFRVPQGVTLEKIRHPQGIELKITVTKEAFTDTDEIAVVPYRDQNNMTPITIQCVTE